MQRTRACLCFCKKGICRQLAKGVGLPGGLCWEVCHCCSGLSLAAERKVELRLPLGSFHFSFSLTLL